MYRPTFHKSPLGIDSTEHHLKRIWQVRHATRSLRCVPGDPRPLHGGSLWSDYGLLDTGLPTPRSEVQVEAKRLLIELDSLGIVTHLVVAFSHHRPVADRIQETIGSHFERPVRTLSEVIQGTLVIRLVVVKEQVVILLARQAAAELCLKRRRQPEQTEDGRQPNG